MLTYKLLTREDDVAYVADVISHAVKDSPFRKFIPNKEALIKTIERYYVHENGGHRFLLLVWDDDKIVGVVGATTLTDHFLFMDHAVGQEIVWWVDKSKRGSKIALTLIKHLEDWARNMDLKHLLMGHYEDEHTEKLKSIYAKLGYTLTEYNYWKELN
jgi:GNAT superfamily N-acetyltransferase